jgi:hypothetical protein
MAILYDSTYILPETYFSNPFASLLFFYTTLVEAIQFFTCHHDGLLCDVLLSQTLTSMLARAVFQDHELSVMLPTSTHQGLPFALRIHCKTLAWLWKPCSIRPWLQLQSPLRPLYPSHSGIWPHGPGILPCLSYTLLSAWLLLSHDGLHIPPFHVNYLPSTHLFWLPTQTWFSLSISHSTLFISFQEKNL